MSPLEVASSRFEKGEGLINEESFLTFLRQRANEPGWLQNYRERNWRRFVDTPEASRRDENWRFGDPKRLGIGKCMPFQGAVDESVASELRQNSNLLPAAAARIVLLNDHCIEEAELSEDMRKQGLVFESLESALLKHPEEIRPHLEAEESDLGSAKQIALHNAHLRNGIYLRIPAGVIIEQTLVAYHWIEGADRAIFPRTIIDAGENSAVTLVEAYLSRDDEHAAFNCAVGSVKAGPQANVCRISVQNQNLNTASFLLDSNNCSRAAKINSVTLLMGSHSCRHESFLNLPEPDGEIRLRSMIAASGDQLFDQRSRQDHQAERCTSDVLCKNALHDKARSVFAGLIRVDEKAQQTDAYQTNRNLVIGSAAEADSMPGLEILANDVKCSHGATTGRIDEEQLFYLKSRGIPTETARQLLTLGFFEEILEESPDDLSETLRSLIREKFESGRAKGRS